MATVPVSYLSQYVNPLTQNEIRIGRALRVKKANVQKYVRRIVANTRKETNKAL